MGVMNKSAATVKELIFEKSQPACISVTRKFTCYTFTMLLLAALLMIIPQDADAQSGSLSGRVVNASNGSPVSHVDVTIPGSDHITQTDLDGRYYLHNIPAGQHRIQFQTIGFITQDITVSVQSGESAVQDVELENDLDENDRFVLSRLQGQAQALNRQQDSWNNRSALSLQQMNQFGDRTIQDALGRHSGVQVNRNGQVNIRGVGLNKYQVLIDGQPMPTSGPGDRSFDLAGLSTDITSDLELVRVITPDMDAEALAGVINLNKLHAVGDDREFSARIGGGGDSRYFNHSGVPALASVKYAEAYREDFSLSASLSWQRDYRPMETLGINYDVADFGNGEEDVIESVSPGLLTDDRSRINAGLQLSYLPSVRTRFYIRGLLNYHDRDLIHHQNIYSAGGDWSRPDSTGSTGGLGRFGYDMQFQDNSIKKYMVQIGSSHLFDRFDVDFSLGWGRSHSNQVHYLFPFQVGNLDYEIDMSDRTRPEMQITSIPQHPSGVPDYTQLRMGDIEREFNDHIDNTYTGRLDINVPVGLFSLKLGSSARLINKEGDFNYDVFGILRKPFIGTFGQYRSTNLEIFNNYAIPRFIDAYKAEDYFIGNRWTLSFSDDKTQFDSSVWNYSTFEQIYAGYGMATLQFGDLTLLGGARMEYTGSRYDGRRVLFDDIGSYREAIDTSANVDYTNLFPHAQVGYAPGQHTNIRLAYSRSLSRPDFNILAPFERVRVQDSTLFRGNPSLDPMTSDNLDFWFEHYFANIGVFSLGMFHKQLDNFIFLSRQTLDEGVYSGWQESKYLNSEETATLYGVEVSWQQRLDFLPGFLGNFGTYTNYTWTDSQYEIDYREDEVALPGQSPHVINAALLYDQGRFSTQLSYHWTAEYLSLIRDEQTLVPSAGTNQQLYMDRYSDGWSDLSFSFRIRITEQFRFWADAYNLLGNERIEYEYDRKLYPVSTNWSGGRTFRAGIRFDL